MLQIHRVFNYYISMSYGKSTLCANVTIRGIRCKIDFAKQFFSSYNTIIFVLIVELYSYIFTNTTIFLN